MVFTTYRFFEVAIEIWPKLSTFTKLSLVNATYMYMNLTQQGCRRT